LELDGRWADVVRQLCGDAVVAVVEPADLRR